ncbi:MAG: choice-of-anchor D domain-containing protein, partial [Pirellulales bacterium]
TGGGNVLLADGASTVDFGSTDLNSAVVREFEISNLGSRRLTLGDPQLENFTQLDDFTSVPAGGVVNFKVQLDANKNGVFREQLSFATDDPTQNPFDVTLVGAVGEAIIDDRDVGYSAAGFSFKQAAGDVYDGDIVWNDPTAPQQTASWTFTNLEPGEYSVAATWRGQYNLGTANYQMFDGGNPAGSVNIDQVPGPDDFSTRGVDWENLDIVTVSDAGSGSGSLEVRLDAAVNGGVVFADAVRIQAVSGPEIGVNDVTGGGGNVNSGDTINFGGVLPGDSATRNLEIRNDGSNAMTVTAIAAPFGFTLVSPAAPSAAAPLTIAGGGKAAVQLRFDGTAGLPGAVKAGQLTIASDDTDEFPFAVNVQASVIPPLAIIDNGNAGFASSAGFLAFGLQGYADPADNLSDVHYAAGDGSGDAATWTFDLAALGLPNGESYSVAATWTAFANRATNATFEIYDGAVLKSSAALNQELSPNDFSDQGVSWEELGGVRINSGTLVVKLTDAANEFVIADAVRIEQSTLPEIEVEVGGTVL